MRSDELCDVYESISAKIGPLPSYPISEDTYKEHTNTSWADLRLNPESEIFFV
jgi:hypothetical protein